MLALFAAILVIPEAHHHFLCSFGLLALLTEVDNGIKVNLLSVLNDNSETALVVVGVFAVFFEGDNDFFLVRYQH